jgi:hypothetical protein
MRLIIPDLEAAYILEKSPQVSVIFKKEPQEQNQKKTSLLPVSNEAQNELVNPCIPIVFRDRIYEPDNLLDESELELNKIKDKICSKLVRKKKEIIFNGKHSEQVFHIFACECDLVDWENKYPNRKQSSSYRSAKKMLETLDKATFRI